MADSQVVEKTGKIDGTEKEAGINESERSAKSKGKGDPEQPTDATTKNCDDLKENPPGADKTLDSEKLGVAAPKGASILLEEKSSDGKAMKENETKNVPDVGERAAQADSPEGQDKDSAEGSIEKDPSEKEGQEGGVTHVGDNEANQTKVAEDSKLKGEDDLNPSGEKVLGSQSKVENSSGEEHKMDVDTNLSSTGGGDVTAQGTEGKKDDSVDPNGKSPKEDPMEMHPVATLDHLSSEKEEIAVGKNSSESDSTKNQTSSRSLNSETLTKALSKRTTNKDAARQDEEKDDVVNNASEDETLMQEKSRKKDTEPKELTPSRPRRTSARKRYQTLTRSLRPRTSGRVQNSGNAPQQSAEQEPSPEKSSPLPTMSTPQPATPPNTSPEKQEAVDDENTPKPMMEANGLVMRIDEAVFVTEDQLDEFKIARLKDKHVRPFEQLTFKDLRTYNRDQLRAYCYAYGMARRKKTEMEADMARYLSYWNKGREGFALHEYVPTSSRVIDRVEPNPSDSMRSVQPETPERQGAATSSISREGSTTPTSTGKAGASVKQPSSRGATPSHTAGSAVTSGRLSGSQGSANPNGANQARAPASSGNSQVIGATQMASQRNTGGAGRPSKAAAPGPPLPRGFGTSFKQRVHARQAGAKFKAAYNGAGPAIVNIVENAAAYFEGKDSPEVILDQAKSYERYQFNVDMLNEIFDGVPEEPEEVDSDVEMTGTENNVDAEEAQTNSPQSKLKVELFKKNVLENIASRAAAGSREEQADELQLLQRQFREMEEKTKYTERMNMRLFQRLERAETKEQIESVKREFETVHNIKFDDSNPRPLVRRKLDKSLPPLVMSDEKCHILRFKVS